MIKCPKCGSEFPAPAQPVCPHCGANLPPALPIGTVLGHGDATYWVGGVLGQGGFGITYRGTDRKTKREVAIKEYFPAKGNHVWAQRDIDGVTVYAASSVANLYNQGRMSFLKEAQMVSKLDNGPASIVKGVDYLEANGTAYLILEFLPGQPLFKAVSARPDGKMTPQEILPKMLPLMDGITWIHGKRMVHRDICPDNIMLMPNGELCLTDFGSARPVDKDMTGFFKPGYAPAEQASTVLGPAGFYSDVYTLAASILFCLTGSAPDDCIDRIAVTSKGQPDPLFLPDCLTEAQKAVFRKALAIRPENRYQTMAEFKNALLGVTPWLVPKPKPTPGPTPNPTPRPVPPPPPPQPKQWWKLVVGVAAAVAVIVVAVVLIVTS